MTSMELFVTELLEEAAPAIIAMNSVPNFEELETKAEELATADHMKIFQLYYLYYKYL